ncbi:GFA family protein [Mesorhizobium sp. BAC0120]|uniref:GFA family protein n=1 Tax=Mesorhizobium sp. BAC0120 TaxID=3090670 RepID=UPI00298CE4C6|nr:GFA family protein [Mesorhizobium sp. BAC0120]MDW6024643.1 GFA family protein [Mesorhizobium sp. BAC0120]
MIRHGSCSCGQVRYQVSGEPSRVGICHCTSCRQETGSTFTAFAVWPRSAFQSSGDFATWSGRSFCPKCGSRLFALRDDEAEIKIGTLENAPTNFTPQYELWTWRREHWLRPVDGARQFQRDPDE